jgi:hypothetical protein
VHARRVVATTGVGHFRYVPSPLHRLLRKSSRRATIIPILVDLQAVALR